MANTDFNSPYYPYNKVYPGYNSYKGAELIPNLLLRYLMDLPDASGYVPQDDNTRPRVRLMKYLWHDGAKPLEQALPTPQEKLSMLYDGDSPVVNTDEEKAAHPKGFRIFPQSFWMPADFRAGTLIKCYMGRVLPYSPYVWQLGIVFEIVVNYMQDNNLKTNAASRLWAMECALVEALHGVNITGIGALDFNRIEHMDDGSHYFHDEGTNLGRQICFNLTWAESGDRDEVVE